jgi:heavy metal translocating P-type ATPase
MAGVAQLVRAPVCGSGGRGFKSHLSPQYLKDNVKKLFRFFIDYKLFGIALIALIAGLVLQLSGYHKIAEWMLSIVASMEVIPLLWGMWRDLRDGTYGIDILAATAIISSVAVRQYWAAIVIVLMLTGGESLEDYAEGRARTELNSLLSSAPQLAHVIRNQKIVDVKASEVREGNKIVIRPGEVVPVDAIITEGSSSFDESSLTGESIPQDKTVGAELLSGSINVDGVITASALRPASESQYEQIIKLVRAASNNQSPFVRLADRYSIPFTAVSFIIAIVAWVTSGHAIRFVDVLVVATPCPLILAAPIAVISGMSRAAKQGIIVKTGAALEKLAEAKTMAFDKTGTLTDGQAIVKSVTTYSDFKSKDVLMVAASVEQNSNHILAKAIVDEARKKGIKPTKAKKITEYSGTGLMANIGGKTVLVGRLSLMKEHGVEIPKSFKEGSGKDTLTYVTINQKLAGVISFEDKIRKESKRTLERLQELGVKNILLITGDNKVKAEGVAKQLGIEQIVADALPGDKLTVIENLEDRPVVFVGDGVNDAPVLTISDVGIALGARGQTAASESADMVIMLDDLGKVATAKEIAKRTFFIAQQSIIGGIILSIILMLIFATGRFQPVYGAIIQEAVDVIVIFNALRAHGAFSKPSLAKLKLKPA